VFFGVFVIALIFFSILDVIVLRAIMIGLGATLVRVLYLFGAFLIFTGIKVWIIADLMPDIANNEPDPASGQISGVFGVRNSQGRRCRKHTRLHEKYDHPATAPATPAARLLQPRVNSTG